ncbi:ATP-binding cassette domain-containing protein [Pelagibius marinus]|uniref:ATP-binding cassette domain-containing protein n=1 Tax=Pelagibius marinus TaxID=2762760 RepID=UPI0018722F58|nr:ATP-binding cassette domain-containing protein [Pelagibius marinus]
MAVLLEVAEVEKDFGGLRAAAGLSLSLGEGEMLCLIGPNGCGKTTLFNLVTGALKADSGSLRFAGEDLRGKEPYEIARLGILRKFQVPGIYPDLPVAENLTVALVGSDDEGEARLQELLDLARLADKRGLPAGSLAHGEKQWLEIAMVLARRPRLLLLDEPTNGMTAAETAATVALIRDLHARVGCAVLVIEHDMGFVRDLGCPVALMVRGRIERRGSYEELQADPLVREVYLGAPDLESA